MSTVLSGRVSSPRDHTPTVVHGVVSHPVPRTPVSPGRPTLVSVPSPSPSQGSVVSGVRVVSSVATPLRVPVSPPGITPAPSVVISGRGGSTGSVMPASRGVTTVVSGVPRVPSARAQQSQSIRVPSQRNVPVSVTSVSSPPPQSHTDDFTPAPVRDFNIQRSPHAPSSIHSPGMRTGAHPINNHPSPVGANPSSSRPLAPSPRSDSPHMPSSPNTFDQIHSSRGDYIEEMYRMMTPSEIEDRVALVRIHYNKMRADFSSNHMPPIGDDWTPVYLERRYNFFCKQVTKSIYGNIIQVLMAGYFFAMEVFLTNFMGLRAAGYTVSQLNLLSRYNFMFEQVGAITISIFEEGSSPVTQFLVLSVINALIFVAVNWVASKMGTDGKPLAQNIMSMIAGLTLQNGDKVRQPPDASFNMLSNIDMGSMVSHAARLFGGGAAASAPAPTSVADIAFDDL